MSRRWQYAALGAVCGVWAGRTGDPMAALLVLTLGAVVGAVIDWNDRRTEPRSTRGQLSRQAEDIAKEYWRDRNKK